MSNRTLADLLESINEVTGQILLPRFLGLPPEALPNNPAQIGAEVSLDFCKPKYYCLTYDANGFEEAKLEILCQLFDDIKPEFIELSPRQAREIETKIGLGEINNIRFTKYKGPFKLDGCFGTDYDNCLYIYTKSETPSFQGYVAEKQFTIDSPEFKDNFVEIEPDGIQLITPSRSSGAQTWRDIYNISPDGEATARTPHDDGLAMVRFDYSIGPHIKKVASQLCNAVRGFGTNDYFKVSISHFEPIQAEILYYWRDSAGKLHNDLGTGAPELKCKTVQAFLSKLSGIESAIKEAYAEVLAAPENLPLVEIVAK